MKIFIGVINGTSQGTGYVSLRQLCETLGVSYSSAVQGKFKWLKNSSVIEIKEIEVIKIKGRGRKQMTKNYD